MTKAMEMKVRIKSKSIWYACIDYENFNSSHEYTSECRVLLADSDA